MKKLFQKLTLLSVVGITGGTLASCINNSQEETSQEPEEAVVELDKNYKADLSILIPSGNENETTMIDNLIEAFNEDYPNITINKKNVSVSSYENTVRNQLAAKTLPDIVWSNSPDFYSLVGMKAVLPLNDYIEKAEVAGHFNFKNDYLTEYFDMGSSAGKYYCVPRSCDSVVTFYNKRLLREAGVNTDKIKNGWTWSDFESVLADYRNYLDTNPKMASKKDIYYCLDANLTSWLYTCYPMLRSFGGEVVNEKKEILLDSAETRETLNFCRDLALNKRYIPKSGASIGSSFDAGTSPFLFQSASISLFNNKKTLKGDIDIVSFPLIDQKNTPKIGSGIAGYCINSQSKEKAAAWQFIEKLMSYDGQQAMARGGLHLPSIRKDLQDLNDSTVEWVKGYETFNLAAYTYGGEYKVTTDFIGKVDTKYKANLDEAVKTMFDYSIKENKTIDQAIEIAVKNIKNAFKR